MRFALLALTLSGILASCRTQPQTQPGPQIGQSTAPLPPEPVAPAPEPDGPKGVTVPWNGPIPTTPPAPPTPTPDAGTGEQPVPQATPDAGVWSPPPDAP